MPAYNAEAYISRAIDSILSQSYQNWHLIVINDASTDGTRSIIELYQEKFPSKITLLNNHEKSGVSYTRNRGIAEANGSWLAFLDADDLWHPAKLDAQLALARSFNANLVYSSYYVIDELGFVYGLIKAQRILTYKDFQFFNPIGNLTGMYRADRLGKVFQENCGHEDYLMWSEVVKRAGKAFFVSSPLAFYQVSRKSLSGKKSHAARWQWDIYQKQKGYSFVKSLVGLCFYALRSITKVKRIPKRKHYSEFITKT